MISVLVRVYLLLIFLFFKSMHPMPSSLSFQLPSGAVRSSRIRYRLAPWKWACRCVLSALSSEHSRQLEKWQDSVCLSFLNE